jgi:hypothetical protein
MPLVGDKAAAFVGRRDLGENINGSQNKEAALLTQPLCFIL